MSVVMDFVSAEVATLTLADFVYMATMSFTTVLYTFAWVFPKAWATTVARALGQHPSDAVGTVCYVAKVLQGVMTFVCARHLASFPPVPALAFAAAMCGAGQFLNYKVYQLLQHDGIFYGCRFGLVVPWVTAFPYSHIRDPQYWGAWLSILGLVYWIPPIPLAWWLFNYNMMMFVESREWTPRYPVPRVGTAKPKA